MKQLFILRLAGLPGGFRPVTLRTWPAEKIAREVVRRNAETSQDELDLLHYLYVEHEPAIQIAFLDAAGTKHENGRMDEALEPPYADAEGVRRGALVVKERFGEDGMRYLRTLARYSHEGWPGIDEVVAGLEA